MEFVVRDCLLGRGFVRDDLSTNLREREPAAWGSSEPLSPRLVSTPRGNGSRYPVGWARPRLGLVAGSPAAARSDGASGFRAVSMERYEIIEPRAGRPVLDSRALERPRDPDDSSPVGGKTRPS